MGQPSQRELFYGDTETRINTQFLRSARISKPTDGKINEYPFTLPILSNVESISFHPSVTYLVGENGSGKSTLIEAIAIAAGFNPEGGSKHLRFSTAESHSCLSQYLRLIRGAKRPRDGYFLRAESFYNVASEIDKLDAVEALAPPINVAYGGASLHTRSHGEAFWTLFHKRFGPNGLYILDEPESALSPNRQLAFLARLHELVQANCQFLIATHSPILMAYPDAKILQVHEGTLRETNYEETDNVQITRNFLNHRQKSLDILLGD